MTNLRNIFRWIFLGIFPLSIITITAIAHLHWTPIFSKSNELQLPISAEIEDVPDISPQEIFNQLKNKPKKLIVNPKTINSKFWILIELPDDSDASVIYLPTRMAREVECWDVDRNVELGASNRNESSKSMSTLAAGFQISLDKEHRTDHIVCRIRNVGAAVFAKAYAIDEAAAKRARQEFFMLDGWMNGAMITLSIISFLYSVSIRNKCFVIFSFWLFVALRTASISAGWDYIWFNWIIPENYLTLSKKITFSLYMVLTNEIFIILFAEEIKNTIFRKLAYISRYSSVIFLPLGALLSYESFLPILWVFAIALIIGPQVFCTVFSIRNPEQLWSRYYAFGITTVLMTSLSEIYWVITGNEILIHYINHVSGAIASCFLIALAVFKKIKDSEEDRIFLLELQAQLPAHIRYAQESERKHLSQELHDTVGTSLSGVIFLLQAAEMQIESTTSSTHLKKAIRECQNILDTTRKITTNLYPEVLSNKDIILALKALTAECQRVYGINSTFVNMNPTISDFTRLLSRDAVTAIFRTCQESVGNIGKHSKAKTMNMVVKGAENFIQVDIKDDGIGINQDHISASPTMGVANMKDRIASVRGTMTISQRASGGTKIVITVPYSDQSELSHLTTQ